MIRLSTVILIAGTIIFALAYELVKLTGTETTEVKKGLNLLFIFVFLIGSILSYKLDKLLSRGDKE